MHIIQDIKRTKLNNLSGKLTTKQNDKKLKQKTESRFGRSLKLISVSASYSWCSRYGFNFLSLTLT